MAILSVCLGEGLGQRGSTEAPLPIISDIAISLITDTSFRVTCNITPNGTLTPVLHWGTTTAYLGTPINGSEISEAGSVIFNVTGLIPSASYYVKVVAGITELPYAPVITTLVPSELSNTAHFGRYLFNAIQNIVSTDQFTRGLMDILHYAVSTTDNLYSNTGTFDSATGWSFNPLTWGISGGKLLGINGGSGNITRQAATAITNAVYRHSFNTESISGSYIRLASLYPNQSRTTSGVSTADVIAVATYVGLSKASATVCQVDDTTGYRILGRHLVSSVLANIPALRSTYIELDGVNDFYQNAVDATATLGTIFIVGQRVGVDAGIQVFNSLSGFGEYTGNVLTIGREAGVYKNVRIVEIFIAGSTLSAGDIARINAYYTQQITIDGWNVPLGKTSAPATNAAARQLIVSVCDDDATENLLQTDNSGQPDYPHSGGFYSRFHPMFVALNRYLLANNLIQPGEEVGFTECCYIEGRLSSDPNNPAASAYYNRWNMLRALQNIYGHNIASHTYSHGEFLDALHDETLAEFEINTARAQLQNEFGFNINTMVWPVGYHSHLTRAKVLEQHACGIAVGGTFAGVTNHNNPPFNKAAISRKTLDLTTHTNAAGDVLNPTTTLNLFKSYVTEANAALGWLVTMSHSGSYFWKNYNGLFIDPTYPVEWLIPVSIVPTDYMNSQNHVVPAGWYPYPGSMLDCLYKTLIYVYELGGKVVLPARGVELMGNLSTVGDVTWGVVGIGATQDALNYDHKAKGVDGSVTAFRTS